MTGDLPGAEAGAGAGAPATPADAKPVAGTGGPATPAGTGARSPGDGASEAPVTPAEAGGGSQPQPPGDGSLGDRRSGAGPGAGGDQEWRRLDKRALLVTGALMASLAAGICLPVLLGLSSGAWFGLGPGGDLGLGLLLGGAALLIVGGVAAEYLNWRRTRYRVGAERVELHTGILLVKRRSLARERVRSVDLTANPLLRILDLVKVRIGTGEQSGGGESTLELDPVTKAEGERLRRELLGRAAATPDTHPEGPLAAVDLSWIRYAPLTFVAPALGGAAAGAVLQVSEWFGAQGEVIGWVGDRFQDTTVVVMVVVLALVALAAGMVGSLGLWVEMWWNYRLEWEAGGTLRVRRGLFTARSLSMEERRLRGVELVEPLGIRLFGAARLDAVATGIAHGDGDQQAELKVLLPPVPRAVAGELAGRVLREARTPTETPLIPHPGVARARRLRAALAAAVVPLALLGAVAWWAPSFPRYLVAGYALVALPLAVFLALDAYRNLGHALSGGYLVARSGVGRRTTVALQRAGVIGWVVRQSVFQRRAGVLTLTATTAAGAGAYSVYDAEEGEGLHFAAAAVPGLLTPFLEPVP